MSLCESLWGTDPQVGREEREWCAGLPTAVFQPFVDKLLASGLGSPAGLGSGGSPRVRVLDAELEPVLLSKAAKFGMPAEWVARLARLDPLRRQVAGLAMQLLLALTCVCRVPCSAAAAYLQ